MLLKTHKYFLMKYHSNYVNMIFAVGTRGESQSNIIGHLLTTQVERFFVV